MLALMSTAIGAQDLAALIAQRPVAAERLHSHNIASPFGTIDAATFSMPQTTMTAMPVSLSYALSGIDPGNADITGSIRQRVLGTIELEDAPPAGSLPSVNRAHKGDRLASQPPSAAQPAADRHFYDAAKGDRLVTIAPSDASPDAAPLMEADAAVARKGDRLPLFAPPAPSVEASASPGQAPDDQTPAPAEPLQTPATLALASVDTKAIDLAADPLVVRRPPPIADASQPDAPAEADEHPDTGKVIAPEDPDYEERVSRLYFGADPADQWLGAIEPWRPGEAPELKDDARAPGTAATIDPGKGGQTIAAKGQVTGEGRHPMSPAERLKHDDRASMCQGGEVPDRSRILRGARRAGARPDRGGAGGDEPRVLRLLPRHGVRRRLPERQPASRLPVHLRVRRHSRRGARARCLGTGQVDFRRDARRQAAAWRWARPRTITPTGCIRAGCTR